MQHREEPFFCKRTEKSCCPRILAFNFPNPSPFMHHYGLNTLFILCWTFIYPCLLQRTGVTGGSPEPQLFPSGLMCWASGYNMFTYFCNFCFFLYIFAEQNVFMFNNMCVCLARDRKYIYTVKVLKFNTPHVEAGHQLYGERVLFWVRDPLCHLPLQYTGEREERREK